MLRRRFEGLLLHHLLWFVLVFQRLTSASDIGIGIGFICISVGIGHQEGEYWSAAIYHIIAKGLSVHVSLAATGTEDLG